MSKILVMTRTNCNDEFTAEGYSIFDNMEEWNHIVEGIPSGQFEAYVGTNEFVQFRNKKDYLSHVRTHEITDEQAKFLKTHLGASFGLFVVKSYNY